MPGKSTKPLYHLLRGVLPDRVIAHGTLLANFEQFIVEQLPEPLNAHCRVANLRNGNLILYTDSPAWSTKLRYLLPAIKQAFESHFKTELKNLSIEVKPAQQAQAPHQGRTKISQASAEHLRQSAAATPYEPLKAALVRLSRHPKRD